ncbi:MAG: sodium:proton antiporter [Legionellales bacterium RIFCSPHIGHO2_12_FULL_42_9]|nr:MAG: sodium:proton antiporter [Legionellales bacterium RIFCSPHIGHO2_12_FULL_42_9]
MFNQSIKSYFSSIILVSSIFLGGIFAIVFKEYVHYLKPLGELFLNLILTAIVPLIFFSVSSAIARTGSLKKLGQIISAMAIVFILTSIVASIFALIMVKIFPPGQGVYLQFAAPSTIAPVRFFNQLVNIVTVSDFSKLFSHDHILPLIVFSILVGLASSVAHEKGKAFAAFLQAGEAVFMQVFALIMLYAPIGFFAYFAVVVHAFGPELMKSYAHIALSYALFSCGYFICVYTGYAYLAGKLQSVRLFWQNIFLPMITSFATCSSAASIPANLVATKAMGVPPEIYETVVPLGTILHKEGSVIGGVIKIAFLFSVFHLDFSSMSVLMTAVGVSLLVGTVMGAIPSGGMLGELLILSVYGFPAEALVSIVAISIVIDPFATLLNVTGNTASSLLIARWVEGKER